MLKPHRTLGLLLRSIVSLIPEYIGENSGLAQATLDGKTEKMKQHVVGDNKSCHSTIIQVTKSMSGGR